MTRTKLLSRRTSEIGLPTGTGGFVSLPRPLYLTEYFILRYRIWSRWHN